MKLIVDGVRFREMGWLNCKSKGYIIIKEERERESAKEKRCRNWTKDGELQLRKERI